MNYNTVFFLCLAFAIVVPYLICSINPAIIAAKIKSGRDIREMGSGNPGLTNTLRTMGKRAAAVVLLCDVLKGVVSILAVMLFVQIFLSHLTMYEPRYVFMWIGSLTAVLGHCYPIYYKFKGGKAVLVTVSTLFVIDWLTAIIALSLFIIIVLITRYVSLGSIVAAILYPLIAFVIGTYVWNSPHMLMAVIIPSMIAIVLVFKHLGNIGRLIQGNEKKLGKRETQEIQEQQEKQET